MLHRLPIPFPRAGTPRCCRRPWFWLHVLAATAVVLMGGVWKPAAHPAGESGSLIFSKPPEHSEANGNMAEGDRDAYTMHEGESNTYTVHLSIEPRAEVTVTLTQPTNTDVMVDTDPSTTGNQNTLSFTPSNWDTAQTVTVSVANDDDTVNENATIGHAASGGRRYANVSDEAQVSVMDNDVPGLIFNPTSLTVAEGGSKVYTVRLAGQPTAPVTVTVTQPTNADVTVDTDPNTAESQTTLTFTPTGNNRWDTTQTVTVSADDDVDIANDAASIAHAVSGAAEYAGVSGDVQVSVMDGDVPGLILSQTSLTVAEGGSKVYTVRLAGQPTAPVKVTLTQPANADLTIDTEPYGADHQRTLMFTTDNSSTAQPVRVTAAEDMDAAPNTATVVHKASGAAEYASLSETLSVTVADDDKRRFVAILSGIGVVLLVVLVVSIAWEATRRWLAVLASLMFVSLVIIAFVSKLFATETVGIVIAALAVISPVIVNAFRRDKGKQDDRGSNNA